MIISQPLFPLCRAGRAEQRSVPPVPTRDHQEPGWDSLLHFSTPWHSLLQLPDQGLPFFSYGKAGLQPPPSLHRPSISFPSSSSAPAPSRAQSREIPCPVPVPGLGTGTLGQAPLSPACPPGVGDQHRNVGQCCLWGIFLGILHNSTLVST